MQDKAKFESGATSHQANNLVLSVLNTGEYYNDRLHCGFAMLQGSYHRVTIKEIVTEEANSQRYIDNLTFPAKSISEAVKLITEQTIEDCLEIIRDEYIKTRAIDAIRRRWLDKQNGNSYFSVNLQIPCKSENNHGEVVYRQVNIPMEYGYGSHWEYAVIDLLIKIGILPELKRYDNGNKDYGYMSDYERKGVIIWHDTGFTQKRNMFEGLYI